METSGQQVFPQHFRVLPNCHECFYNLTEIWRTFFSVSFRKYCNEKKENQLVYFDHLNENSLCHRYNNSLRICFGLFSKFLCMASMYQEHFTCTNFVQTFGECSVFCSVSFFFFSNTIIKSYQVLTTISLEIKMTVPVTKIYTLDVKSTCT